MKVDMPLNQITKPKQSGNGLMLIISLPEPIIFNFLLNFTDDKNNSWKNELKYKITLIQLQ